jgi:hypothetical protein
VSCDGGDDATALGWSEEVARSRKTAAARVAKKQSVKHRRAGARGSKHNSVAKHGAAAQPEAKKSTKLASMTVLLCRIKGVSLEELCRHTGWQPHSVRAVISSVMKKKLGLDVVSERVDGKRVYRVIV